MVLGLSVWQAAVLRAADDVDQKAVDRAHDFLKTAARGRDVLSYMHFGSRYDGHSYRESRFVTREGRRVPGHFALVYRYKWQGNGLTDVAFLCDARGDVYEVQAIWTNAVLNQPWVSANLTIKVLGGALAELFKDKMTEKERQDLQQLIEDANAKGMLEWSLKIQQALGL
jgi:hypothetical protein